MAAKAPVSAGEKSEQEAAEDARLDEVSEGLFCACWSEAGDGTEADSVQ